jgi:hypothetical protein
MIAMFEVFDCKIKWIGSFNQHPMKYNGLFYISSGLLLRPSSLKVIIRIRTQVNGFLSIVACKNQDL